MKKVVLFLLLFFVGNVLALEGVSPGSYSVDYESGLKKDFLFDFILDDKEDLRIEGDLAKYISLNKDEVVQKEQVVVSLDLFEDLEKFGANEAWIIAGNIRALVRVNVPYPDKFVGVEVDAPNVNAGENVELVVDVLNLGTEFSFIDVELDIFQFEDGVRVFLIDSFKIGAEWINISKTLRFEKVLETLDYPAGDYLVVAKVDYGDGVIEEENVFRLGEFRAGIFNYSKEVYSDIEKFEVGVENFWNNKMSNVYVEVRAVDFDRSFDSVIVNLNPWERKILSGFFDLRDISGEIEVEIILHYGDEVVRDVVYVNVLEKNRWWIDILLGLIFIILFIILKRKLSKHLKLLSS